MGTIAYYNQKVDSAIGRDFRRLGEISDGLLHFNSSYPVRLIPWGWTKYMLHWQRPRLANLANVTKRTESDLFYNGRLLISCVLMELINFA